MSTSQTTNLTKSSRRWPALWTVVAVLTLGPTHVNADEISIWNFNDSDLIVDHGAGTLTTDFNLANVVFTLGGTSVNARQGNPAGQSVTLQGGTSNSNNGRNLTLNVGTLGLSNIVVSFATQGTSTGFNSNQFQYSLDGLAFMNFGTPYTPALTFGLITFDLSSIPGLNNNPDAAFRIVFNGATSSSGNNRIDNIVVEGQPITTPIPEPGSLLLFSLGLSAIGATRFKGWLRKLHRCR